MLNERFQVVVNVSVMNRLVEIFTNPCKLRYKGQRVKDQWRLVLSVKKLVLRNSRQTTALHKLLREVFRAFRSKYQTGYKTKSDGYVFFIKISEGVEC